VTLLAGFNIRAVIAFLVGMSPDLISVMSGVETLFGASAAPVAAGRGLHSSTSQLNLSRF
jgi:cytosine/uracil/thiamine/allantoin permease